MRFDRSPFALVFIGLACAGFSFSPHVAAQTIGAANSATIDTQTGKVRGRRADNGVFAFKGIPYAAPPVGNLRWREPQAPAPWDGVREASTYGNSCIQTSEVSGDISQGDPGPLREDCLYLNIWTTRANPVAKKPVMVWIHGGAFVIGTGGLPLTEGGPLAKKGVVVVTLNYRLGQLGFFAHPALEKENPGGVANFGLLDQIAALKWVKQNIAKFGGDPDNVTIFGQSAGGKSVLALYASPLAQGLFHKGIVQSSYIIPDMTRPKAIEMGAKVATAVGLPGGDATAAALRSIDAQVFGALKGQGLSTAPVSISGDPVLPVSIEDMFEAGKEAALPLIIGNTSDDASVASAFGINPVDVLKKLGAAGFVVRVLYPGISDESQRARQVARDLVFTMPVRWIADRHAKRAKTWRYYFDYTAVKLRKKYPNGVPHGDDVVFAFNTGDIHAGTKNIFTAEDRAFSRLISDYWVEFARTGEPSSDNGPEWPNDRPFRDRTMMFGEDTTVRSNFLRARLNALIGLTRIIDAVAGPK